MTQNPSPYQDVLARLLQHLLGNVEVLQLLEPRAVDLHHTDVIRPCASLVAEVHGLGTTATFNLCYRPQQILGELVTLGSIGVASSTCTRRSQHAAQKDS